MKVSRRFSPYWFERQWAVVRWLSNILQPYRNMTGWRHIFITRLYLKLLLKSQYAEPALMRELQLIRLKKILKIAGKTAWWREYFKKAGFDPYSITKLEDLQRLPPINKLIMRDVAHSQLVAPRANKNRVIFRRTSGTTATPFEWGVDKNVLFVETAAYFYRMLKDYNLFPSRRGKQMLVARIGSFDYKVPLRQFFWDPSSERTDEEFLSMLAHIREEGLRIFSSYSTYLILFAKKLSQLQEPSPFNLVISSGQELDDTTRAYIEKSLTCRVVFSYSSVETLQIGTECPEHRNYYHLNSERILLEVTDEFGQNLPDGEEGVLTVTSLENRDVPLIRYQLGDRGKMLTEKCSCGRTLPFFEFKGREPDFIRLQTGELLLFQLINVILLTHFFHAIELYQLEQKTLTELIIRLRIAKNTNKDELEKQLLAKLETYTRKGLSFVFEYPRDWGLTPGKKIKTIIPLPASNDASRPRP